MHLRRKYCQANYPVEGLQLESYQMSFLFVGYNGYSLIEYYLYQLFLSFSLVYRPHI